MNHNTAYLLFCLVIIDSCTTAYSPILISGVVKDGQTQQPVSGISVLLTHEANCTNNFPQPSSCDHQISVSTQTDINGAFNLETTPTNNDQYGCETYSDSFITMSSGATTPAFTTAYLYQLIPGQTITDATLLVFRKAALSVQIHISSPIDSGGHFQVLVDGNSQYLTIQRDTVTTSFEIGLIGNETHSITWGIITNNVFAQIDLDSIYAPSGKNTTYAINY